MWSSPDPRPTKALTAAPRAALGVLRYRVQASVASSARQLTGGDHKTAPPVKSMSP